MPDLKHLRSRITSIKSTQKITKAMQMVSASKLKKLKSQVLNSEHYVNLVNHIAFNTLNQNTDNLSLLEQKFFNVQNPINTKLLIIITSERGLCGPFNAGIIKKLRLDISELNKQGVDFKLIIIGTKGYNNLWHEYKNHVEKYFNFSKNEQGIIILQMQQQIVELISSGQVGECFVYFNKFKNIMTQEPSKEQIAPVEPRDTLYDNHLMNYEYEGDNLVLNTINSYIKGHINFALLHSITSEEASRMISMDNATKNAKDMIDKLTLQLNRSRQAMITKELIEIISGAEAL